MIRWYVVQTHSRKERLAEHHLQNQKFRTFFPTSRSVRKIGTKRQSVLAPFFPNYLFVALDLERERWRSINGTIGVSRLVCFGSSNNALPAPLPSGLVERLDELSSTDGELQFDEPFKQGDRVRVVGGPLDRLCGILQSAGQSDRVTILLDVLARQTPVQISRSQLIPA